MSSQKTLTIRATRPFIQDFENKQRHRVRLRLLGKARFILMALRGKRSLSLEQHQWSIALWARAFTFQERCWKIGIEIRNLAPLVLGHDYIFVAGADLIGDNLRRLRERIDRPIAIENHRIAVK
jgi:hypothetical protein